MLHTMIFYYYMLYTLIFLLQYAVYDDSFTAICCILNFFPTICCMLEKIFTTSCYILQFVYYYMLYTMICCLLLHTVYFQFYYNMPHTAISLLLYAVCDDLVFLFFLFFYLLQILLQHATYCN